MTIKGTVTHAQNTVHVTGGGQRPSRTTHIALFRVDGRQVTFRGGRPLSVGDSDTVVVAGTDGSSGFTAYAVRNVTTGESQHTGGAGKIIMGLLFPIFGLVFCGVASFILGPYASYIWLLFVGYSLYLFYQAFMAHSSSSAVRSHAV